MRVRKANVNDALGVAKVHVDSWKKTYKNIVPEAYLAQMNYENREKKWKEIISKQAVFVAENNKGNIVGFSNVGEERTGKYPDYEAELYAIYILKTYQGQGIGKLLFKSILEYLKEKNIFSMQVSVLEENQSKLFYIHFGANEIGRQSIEISGKKLKLLTYGWKDINEINEYFFY